MRKIHPCQIVAAGTATELRDVVRNVPAPTAHT
jgi:hypothetical protein